MTDLVVSRRAVTCALATLPAIGIPSIAAATSRAGMQGDDTMNAYTTIVPATKHSTWEAALARHEAAVVAREGFDEDVFEPAWQEVRRRAPRPELTMVVPNAPGYADHYDVHPSQLDHLCEDPFYGEYARPLRDAWNTHLAQEEKASIELKFDAIAARSDQLFNEMVEAHTELMLMPAPSLAALRWKLEQAIEPGEGGEIVRWSDDTIRLTIVADYQRLLPAARLFVC